MNVKLQGNAELVYNFIDSNSNMYFQCNNNQNAATASATPSFFSYYNEQPYASSFEEQGYKSTIIFSNIGATTQNLSNILVATVAIMLLITILKHFGRYFASQIILV